MPKQQLLEGSLPTAQEDESGNALRAIQVFDTFKEMQEAGVKGEELKAQRTLALGGIASRLQTLSHVPLTLNFDPTIAQRNGAYAGFRYSRRGRFSRQYFYEQSEPVTIDSPKLRTTQNQLMLDTDFSAIFPDRRYTLPRPATVELLNPGTVVDFHQAGQVQIAERALSWKGNMLSAPVGQFISALVLGDEDERAQFHTGLVEPERSNILFGIEEVDLDSDGLAVARVQLIQSTNSFEGAASLFLQDLSLNIVSRSIEPA